MRRAMHIIGGLVMFGGAGLGYWIGAYPGAVMFTLLGLLTFGMGFVQPDTYKPVRTPAPYGDRNPHMVCPHCQTKGTVDTKPITVKTGISGGKATGALLTGGVSLLATGLSRKEQKTQARCWKCETVWTF